jgi:hypothetical protein
LAVFKTLIVSGRRVFDALDLGPRLNALEEQCRSNSPANFRAGGPGMRTEPRLRILERQAVRWK